MKTKQTKQIKYNNGKSVLQIIDFSQKIKFTKNQCCEKCNTDFSKKDRNRVEGFIKDPKHDYMLVITCLKCNDTYKVTNNR